LGSFGTSSDRLAGWTPPDAGDWFFQNRGWRNLLNLTARAKRLLGKSVLARRK